MEPLNKHRLVKLNHANIIKNQKKLNSKINQKKNGFIKISDNNPTINGITENNNQNIYKKNFTLNSNSIFKPNNHNHIKCLFVY